MSTKLEKLLILRNINMKLQDCFIGQNVGVNRFGKPVKRTYMLVPQ